MLQGLAYTNRMAIAAFNRKRGVPKDGSQLTLPDIGQVHTVVGKLFWKYRDRFPKVAVSLVFQSNCAVCGSEYTYNVPLRARTLVRTCTEHRRQWRSHEYTLLRPKPKPFRNKVATLLATHLRSTEQARHKDIVISIAAKLTKPDHTRPKAVTYNVRRAMQSLLDDCALPPHVRITETHFIWAP